MSKLIAVLSPAKLLDDQTHYPDLDCTAAEFTNEAKAIASKLKKLQPSELASLMSMSAALGNETQQRYQSWHLPFTHQNAHPAMLMFKGEVYRGLQAHDFNVKQLDFAQKHVRILSGLYGILKPLDLIMPYRLMMGTGFAPDKKNNNLYSFWREKITASLERDLDKKGVLIDLASQEYFKAIDLAQLNRRIVTCEFRESKGGKHVVVNTYAKQARGMMARFIIENAITKPEDLRGFDLERYRFQPTSSDNNRLVFVR
jgi:hypothetical protein